MAYQYAAAMAIQMSAPQAALRKEALQRAVEEERPGRAVSNLGISIDRSTHEHADEQGLRNRHTHMMIAEQKSCSGAKTAPV